MDEAQQKRFLTVPRYEDRPINYLTVAAILFALCLSGCQRSAAPSTDTAALAASPPPRDPPPASPSTPQLPEIAARPATVSLEMANSAADPDWWKDWYQGLPSPSMPRVYLSRAHQQTCVIHVGDRLPSLPLQTLAGQPTMLSSHLSSRASVVIFWDLRQPMSIDLIRHLATDFTERYRPGGIQIITVSVGAKEVTARETLERLHGASETIHLVDRDATSFHLVATDGLPRIFLVAADGTVEWFDIEYSRSMRRALDQAIIAHALGIRATAR